MVSYQEDRIEKNWNLCFQYFKKKNLSKNGERLNWNTDWVRNRAFMASSLSFILWTFELGNFLELIFFSSFAGVAAIIAAAK